MGAGQSRTSRARSAGRTRWYDQEAAAVVDSIFTPKETKQLRKAFMKDHPSGTVSRAQFVDAYAAFFPFSNSSEIAHHIFCAIDTRVRDFIDFEQYVHALAMTQRGSEVQKIRFAFNVFDTNGDGVISRSEYEQIQAALRLLACSSSGSRSVRTNGVPPSRSGASGLPRSSSCGCLNTVRTNAKAARRSTQATIDTCAFTFSKATGVARHPVSKRLSAIQRDTHYDSQPTVGNAPTRVRPPLTPQPTLHLSRRESDPSDSSSGIEGQGSRLSPLSPTVAVLPSSVPSKLSRPSTLYDSGKADDDNSSQSALSDVSSEEGSSNLRYDRDRRPASAYSPFSDDEPEDVFAAMDMNDDGIVDFDEFLAAVKRDPSLLRFLQVSE